MNRRQVLFSAATLVGTTALLGASESDAAVAENRDPFPCFPTVRQGQALPEAISRNRPPHREPDGTELPPGQKVEAESPRNAEWRRTARTQAMQPRN